MAEKASTRRRSAKARARKANGGAVPGHNSGQVPREVYQRHLGYIATAAKASKAADEIAKKKRSVLSNCYKSAKSDGCNVESIKIARKLDEGDHVEAVNDYAEVGAILDIMDSGLHTQFKLFANIDRPAPVSAYIEGLKAGRAAQPAENNPYQHRPGSEEFTQWASGWAAGQNENADKFREHNDTQPNI